MKRLKKKILERITYEENINNPVVMTRKEKVIIFVFLIAAVGIIGMVVYDSFINLK